MLTSRLAWARPGFLPGGRFAADGARPFPRPLGGYSIQQSAALALGRLANYSDDLAEAVVGNEILPQLVYSLR